MNRRRSRLDLLFRPRFLASLLNPYYPLTELDSRFQLTPNDLRRKRPRSRAHRAHRVHRSNAAELARCMNRLSLAERLFHLLCHPASLCPRFLRRNKKRRTHPLRREKLPQSI